jgi:polysaccharide biosynthesis protein PslH
MLDKQFTVLHIGSYKYIKPDAGGKVCMYHSLNYLSRYCRVIAVSPISQEDDAKFLPEQRKLFSTSALRYANPMYIFSLKKIVKEEKVDCIILEHCYFAWLAFAVKKICKVPLVIRSQNVEYNRFKTFGKWWWPILKQYEIWSAKVADVTLCITKADLKTYSKHVAANKLMDFPFGTTVSAMPVDRAASKQKVCDSLGIDTNTKLLFYNGALGYAPNKHGLDFILEKLNPVLATRLQKYKIIICGGGLADDYDKLSAYAEQHIVYLGFVDDIGTYFKAADVFLNPVIGGGGIKTKLIEAIAHGTTVVSSIDGANGFDEEVAPHKIVKCTDDNVEEMCSAILDVLAKPYEATPESYYAHYYWDTIMQSIVTRLKHLKN